MRVPFSHLYYTHLGGFRVFTIKYYELKDRQKIDPCLNIFCVGCPSLYVARLCLSCLISRALAVIPSLLASGRRPVVMLSILSLAGCFMRANRRRLLNPLLRRRVCQLEPRDPTGACRTCVLCRTSLLCKSTIDVDALDHRRVESDSRRAMR